MIHPSDTRCFIPGEKYKTPFLPNNEAATLRSNEHPMWKKRWGTGKAEAGFIIFPDASKAVSSDSHARSPSHPHRGLWKAGRQRCNIKLICSNASRKNTKEAIAQNLA
jgi:hypothetical protein